MSDVPGTLELALGRPALVAPDPQAWLDGHLAACFPDDTGAGGAPPLGVGALLADGAAALRAVHDGITAQGTPAQAASHYLADWFAGSVAGAVGLGLAAGGCGFVVEAEELRWRLHSGGWPEALRLGTVRTTIVLPGHPWAGRPGVTVVDTADAVIEPAVAGVVAAVEPLLEACRSFARVGRPGLWNEVGDGLGGLLSHQDRFEVAPAMLEVVEAAARCRAAPWKATPSVRLVPGRTGPVFVLQKGGCCLAYTREVRPEEQVADADLDDAARAYRAAFPPPAPGEPWYCANCSFRSAEDCDARVVTWRDLSRS